MSLISVSGLTVDFPVEGGRTVRAVDDLSLELAAGGAVGVVGESGSGKSTVAAALLGLHRGTGTAVSGSVRVADVDVRTAGEAELRRLRGGLAAMVFQDPLSSLDPYYAVGDQIAEVYRVHRRDASRRAARARAVEVLDRVGIPDAARRSRSRPHEFSGGMRQRSLIAMALACEPRLLIADEPTTELDVTVQAQILDLLHELRTESGMGLLLVTHDLGVVAGSVDEVLVMKDGRAVERGPVASVLGAPREAYTAALLSAVPRITSARPAFEAEVHRLGGGAFEAEAERLAGAALEAEVQNPARPAFDDERRGRDAAAGRDTGDQATPLLEVNALRKDFRRGRRTTTAVDGADLTLHEGEALGIVGESGSGKTTLGRMIVGLLAPTSGTISHRGDTRTRIRREVQMVFQDPASSLNPRRSIGESVADPLRTTGGLTDDEIRTRVRDLLARVGLDPEAYHRYPHEFSGGQRQRVGIARALAPGPRLLVCDEPVSALDVTTQAQIIGLLGELRRELGLSLLFIAHDLAVVRQVSDRVAVMRQGRIVEQGPVGQVYGDPAHPYTRELLAAVPVLDPERAGERREVRRAVSLAQVS